MILYSIPPPDPRLSPIKFNRWVYVFMAVVILSTFIVFIGFARNHRRWLDQTQTNIGDCKKSHDCCACSKKVTREES